MPATITHDFELPMNCVAQSAIEAIHQLGYPCTANSRDDSSRTLTFQISSTPNESYILVVKQIVPTASRVIVSGMIPQVCQSVIDRIQHVQLEINSGAPVPKTQGT